MAIGKVLGDFSFKITSTAYAEDNSVYVTVDGTASNYGTVLGTLILRGEPNGKSGTLAWRGQGFLDDGSTVAGSGQGTYEEMGKHQWRTRAIITVSNGDTIASDGKIDLATRTYTGKNLSWE